MTLDAVSLRSSLHKAWACVRKHLTGVTPRMRRK
jgi:urease accessory protein